MIKSVFSTSGEDTGVTPSAKKILALTLLGPAPHMPPVASSGIRSVMIGFHTVPVLALWMFRV